MLLLAVISSFLVSEGKEDGGVGVGVDASEEQFSIVMGGGRAGPKTTGGGGGGEGPMNGLGVDDASVGTTEGAKEDMQAASDIDDDEEEEDEEEEEEDEEEAGGAGVVRAVFSLGPLYCCLFGTA
jgi:hypothetical protein